MTLYYSWHIQMPSVTAQPSREQTSNKSRPRNANAIHSFTKLVAHQQKGTHQSLSQPGSTAPRLDGLLFTDS